MALVLRSLLTTKRKRKAKKIVRKAMEKVKRSKLAARKKLKKRKRKSHSKKSIANTIFTCKTIRTQTVHSSSGTISQ